MGRGERETTSGDSRVEGVLIAMRVSELPARDSSTKNSRTKDGREGRESAVLGDDESQRVVPCERCSPESDADWVAVCAAVFA